MKHVIAATIATTLLATSATAGGFSTIVEEPDVVVVTPTASSGEWMPLIIFAALVTVAIAAGE